MKGLWLAVALGSASVVRAQAIGSVAFADADVTAGGSKMLPVASGRAELTGSATVTAKDRTAAITLARGGTVRVCRTTPVHLAAGPDALVLGLDRGAMEIKAKAAAGDVVMTPDMRITMPGGGELDLRMRVSPDGDTCVENRGKKAPALMISDAFGEADYLVKPGQHVLFEHGSLRAVVDHETTPCGCPPDEVRAVPLAEALLSGGPGSVTAQAAAAAHPFPEAVSAGLAPAAAGPMPPVGVEQTQVSTTLAASPGEGRSAAAAPVVAAPSATSAEAKGGPFRAVGRFFKRIFVR